MTSEDLELLEADVWTLISPFGRNEGNGIYSLSIIPRIENEKLLEGVLHRAKAMMDKERAPRFHAAQSAVLARICDARLELKFCYSDADAMTRFSDVLNHLEDQVSQILENRRWIEIANHTAALASGDWCIYSTRRENMRLATPDILLSEIPWQEPGSVASLLSSYGIVFLLQAYPDNDPWHVFFDRNSITTVAR